MGPDDPGSAVKLSTNCTMGPGIHIYCFGVILLYGFSMWMKKKVQLDQLAVTEAD